MEKKNAIVTAFSENTAPFTPLLNECNIAPAERLIVASVMDQFLDINASNHNYQCTSRHLNDDTLIFLLKAVKPDTLYGRKVCMLHIHPAALVSANYRKIRTKAIGLPLTD